MGGFFVFTCVAAVAAVVAGFVRNARQKSGDYSGNNHRNANNVTSFNSSDDHSGNSILSSTDSPVAVISSDSSFSHSSSDSFSSDSPSSSSDSSSSYDSSSSSSSDSYSGGSSDGGGASGSW